MKKPLLRTCFVLQLFISLLAAPGKSFAQKTFFGEKDPGWENNKAPVIPNELKNYPANDLVIINDQADFFYAQNNQKLNRHLLIKINNGAGREALHTFRLPESFDFAFDACLYKQGRQARIKTPFISEFLLTSLVARKFENNRWKPLSLAYKYETNRWIDSTGQFVNRDVFVFSFKEVKEGDLVEIKYELQFTQDYGANLFYLNARYPKLNCEYSFSYVLGKKLEGYAFIFPMHLPDSAVARSVGPAESGNYSVHSDKIKLSNLAAINYPANSFEGQSLPHVFVDFTFYTVVTGSYSDPTGKVYEYKTTRPRNFEWMGFMDTTNHFVKIYDKYFTSLRKFVATLPPVGADSSHKEFFKALCDTLNGFRYITNNQLFYNESGLYNVSSADHLLKRRLVGSTRRISENILNDNGIFYYMANVQDRRYGEHSTYYRAHYKYEQYIIAVPSNGSYIYFVPRYNGVNYHLNELPFYFEGSTAALSPRNFQQDTKDKHEQFFKFIKTHKGTFNENTRTENATVKISLDSLAAGLTIKESLSGQFSTVLRHLYLNEYIDSTIAPHYFKKCTEKPNASAVKIKQSSRLTDFPFRYNFNCTEKVRFLSATRLDLSSWFSFIISKQVLPEAPTHTYYFDFEFSDAYNFLLDFGRPVEITNAADFSKKISNVFFELESELVPSSETAYLLKVKVQVKERKIPLENIGQLMELVAALDALNAFDLQVVKK